MNRKQSLLWLMSLLMLAVAPVFTACSDGTDDNKNDPNVIKAGENDPLGEPIGLVYTDFITPNDVIHNADTTELTISKALADKKGITNFVNRPMGIWDDKEHAAYLRRATEQRLVDDHYVLKVVRSSIGEVMNGREATLNTGLYYNPERAKSRILTRAADGSTEADKYIDDENIIHPAAITVQRKTDDGSNGVRSTRGVTRGDGNSATYTVEELFTGQPSGANGWFDWLEDAWNEIVEATSYDWDDDKTISLIHTNTTIARDFDFPCGDGDDDNITLKFKCPVQFDLDYTLNIRSHGSIETAFVPIPSYLETYIDGYFEANPQLLIAFSKSLSLPEDKQRITLFQFSGIGFTFMIGPVPLTIDLDPSIYLKFTSTLKGVASFGVRYDIATKFKAGVKYDGNKWSGIADGEKVKDMFSFINPKVSFGYSGSAGIYFGVDVIIEKVAGPSFNVGPQVMVDAQLSYQVGDDHMKAEIEAKAGIGGEAGAKIKIFGFNVAQWESSFDIGPQWTIFKYPDDGSGSSGNYDPDKGGGGILTTDTLNLGLVKSDYEVPNGQTLTGTLGEKVKISIADGATVTLNNANINGTSWYGAYRWAGITCNGDATIVLQGVNNVRGFNQIYPGIYVPEGHTLTIMGSGTLNASSNGVGAGIGGIYEGVNCGNIVIEGGIINATGSTGSAGIGGGGRSSCGDITIEGGTISATGGNGAAGIGSGLMGSCGNITITDGVTKLTARKDSSAPYSIGAGSDGSCGTITIGGKVTGNISTSPFTYTPGSGGPSGTIDLSILTSQIVASNGDVITGKLCRNVKISIGDGATVTLDGVTINGTNDPNCPWAGITCQGNATLVLKGTNTVKGFAKNYPGIHIPKGKTLTIRGDGSLAATSNDYGAGIGGGYEMDCGNIVVESGTVKATGSSYAAGIGSGYTAACGNITLKGGTIEATGGSSSAGIGSAFQGSCGNITITNGVTEVTATAGSKCPNSIGAGASGSCGTVTIDGKVTGSITTSPYTYDPKVVTGVTLSRTSVSLYIGETMTLTATVAPDNARDKSVTWSSSNTAVATVADGKVTAKSEGNATITVKTNNGGKTATCTVTVTKSIPGAVNLNSLTGNYEAKKGDVLNGTLGKNVKISIADGATVTLDGVNINGSGSWTGGNYAGINCEGNATIILKGSNTVKGFYKVYPGIHVPEGKTVTIKGDGSLTASSNGNAAGIGGGGEFGIGSLSCGNIVIEGGNITATGGDNAAGIGGGYKAACGNITIKGGTVNAKGGDFGAGIGGGREGSCGNITITDGVTKVTATKGAYAPYSIGAGHQGSCGTVTIAATGVSLSHTSASLKVGETLTLKATITPDNATDKSVTWSSSNTAVATVADGKVTAKGPGTATITVKTKDGGKTATCKVTVIQPVTGVSLSQSSASLKVGETLTLKATVTPDNATDKSVTWSSSNTTVATVADGKVTAKAAGTATITVKTNDGAKTATCTVTVGVLVTGVTLSQTSASLKVGETLTLKATVAPDNATDKSVTWSSSNTAVATVSDGKVTAKAAGTATITVKTNNGAKTATCTVTVVSNSTNTVDLSTITSNYKSYGDVLSGTLKANVKISIADGATVTLDGVNINGSGTWTGGNYAGINCEGNATIILKGSNTVKGFYKVYPGIHVPEGKTVTIKGDGSLTASSNGNAAGIGGGGEFGIGSLSCGNIVIEGGNITATGGDNAAGIGGGYKAACGNITIKGGTVNAKGGDFGAGIGGGREGSCGDITITNGVTKVTATKGAYAPYSIGAGHQGSCGTVTIGGKTGAISTSPYTYKP